jgi:hypothetical protein
VVVLPTEDPKDAIVTFFIMSANGNPTTSAFGDLNGNAITVAAEGRVRTDFFGLIGHQLFGTTFSNKKFTSIDARLDRDTIENGALKSEKGSWNIYYNFDQYLYQPKKGEDKGIGLFGRLGVADGNANFLKFFGSFGVGGKESSRAGPTMLRRRLRRMPRLHKRRRLMLLRQRPQPKKPRQPCPSTVPYLPPNCSSTVISGTNYFNCNGVYYKPGFEGNHIVYIVSTP